jgi:methyl-accepting chemotaxis protein
VKRRNVAANSKKIMSKDIIYIIAISLTAVISIINLYYTVKNRKNPLREHVYKEQLVGAGKLIAAFYQLNNEISRIFNAREISNDNLQEMIEKVGESIYQYEHIMVNEIITLANEVVTGSDSFFLAIGSGKLEEINMNYENYFKSYFSLIQLLRDTFGIDELSKENQSLYKLPKYLKSILK